MTDELSINAPAPLTKFNTTIPDPDNVELMQGDDSARPLPRRQLRQLKKERAALVAKLKAANYDQLNAKRESARRQFHNLHIELHNARAAGDNRRAKMIYIRMKKYQAAYRKITRHLQPVAPQAARVREIRDRINEHREAIANDKLNRLLRKQLAHEVKTFADFLIDTWVRLGYCWRYHHKGREITESPKIETAVVTEDEIQYKVKVSSLGLLGQTKHHLPNGVKGWDLIREETLKELEMATERQVTSPHTEDDEKYGFQNGAWLIVGRMGLTGGLFNRIGLAPVMARYPADKKQRFPMPLGVKRGRVINWQYLTKHPHIFVNGTTGSGKSNLFNVIVSTFVRNHSPDDLRLILIDLKEGAEFNQYEKTPHIMGGVVTELPELVTIAHSLEYLRRERMKRFRSAGELINDIDSYNRIASPERRMPRVVVVVDEYHVISMNKEYGDPINWAFTQLATKARAAGIHLILGTQIAYNQAVPNMIKGNITLLLTGRLRTTGSSVATAGSNKATKLDALPGRMLCVDGIHEFPVQIPHATNDDIRAAIADAQHWPAPRPFELPDMNFETGQSFDFTMPVFDESRLIATVIDELDCNLGARPIYDYVKENHNVTFSEVQALVAGVVDRGAVEYEGRGYLVSAFRKGHILREAETEESTITA